MKLNFHRAHVRLWTWLSANPTKCKSEWPEWKRNGGKVPHVSIFCFPCHIDGMGDDNCGDCSIDFPKECSHPFSLFKQWGRAEGANKRMRARTIADLPWKGRKIFTYKDGKWS